VVIIQKDVRKWLVRRAYLKFLSALILYSNTVQPLDRAKSLMISL